MVFKKDKLPPTPEVFEYLDYREYLKAYYTWKKEINRSFSYLMFSKLAGKGSPNFIKYIIDGKRKLNVKNIPNICSACKLEGKKLEYLATLIKWNESYDPVTREFLWKHLKKMIPKTKYYVLKEFESKILNRWYFLLLIEMINHKNFKYDPEWISKMIYSNVSPQEIQQTYQLLIDMGLIEKTGSKLRRQKTKIISTSDLPSEFIRNYHKNIIPLGIEALTKIPVTKRQITSATLSIKKNDINFIKQKIKEFRDEIIDHVEKVDQADEIYQLNLQFFPLVR